MLWRISLDEIVWKIPLTEILQSLNLASTDQNAFLLRNAIKKKYFGFMLRSMFFVTCLLYSLSYFLLFSRRVSTSCGMTRLSGD